MKNFNSVKEYEKFLDKYEFQRWKVGFRDCPRCDTETPVGKPRKEASGNCTTCGNEFHWETSSEDDYCLELSWVRWDNYETN